MNFMATLRICVLNLSPWKYIGLTEHASRFEGHYQGVFGYHWTVTTMGWRGLG